MKNSTLVGVLAVLLVVCVAGKVHAVIIDFTLSDSSMNYLAVGDGYNEDGYNFSYDGSVLDANIVAASPGNVGTMNSSGSDFYTWKTGTATMTNLAATPFDLISLDVGAVLDQTFFASKGPATFDIKGIQSDGTVKTFHVVGVTDFTKVVFDNWTDLTSVQFINVDGDDGAIDNLEVEPYTGGLLPPSPPPVPSNPIPEPATMLLFGVGLVGMATRLRLKGNA